MVNMQSQGSFDKDYLNILGGKDLKKRGGSSTKNNDRKC